LKVYLVRHAKAEKRSGWDGPLPLRPLTPVGLEQARALAVELASDHIARVVVSPHLRCRQTAEPLAQLWGATMSVDQRLAEGEPGTKAAGVLDELDDRPTLLCSHGDVIAALMSELEERGAEIETPFRCEKASVWIVERVGDRLRARYRPAPERTQVLDHAPSERLGVLDMGSTSFRLLVSDVTRAGRITPAGTEKVLLRLGAAVAEHGEIPAALADRTVDAAREFGRTARSMGVERLFPVGTAALRDASNGRWLAERVGIALGRPVRVLTGEEEARLAFVAFRRRVLAGPPGIGLGADLGGGSMQLVLGDDAGPTWAVSFPIGVTRLHREFVEADPMPQKTVVGIRARVRESLERAEPPVAWPRLCIVGGGTARALARLVLARRGKPVDGPVNQLHVSRTSLAGLADDLVRSTHAERLAMAGMHKQRIDRLPTGALILATAAETLDLDGFVVSDWGLREGVMLSIRDGQLTVP